jgi:DNA polymerase-3 subunit epsilon
VRLLTLDCEATGVDPHNDRIVQIFVGVLEILGEAHWVDKLELLIDPGVEIPQGAIDVHHITNERVQEEGEDPQHALTRVRLFLSQYRDLPFVIMNARYDVPLVNAELERVGLKRLPTSKIHWIDPLVIDRGKDRYRKGSRKLESLAVIYNVPFDPVKAHDAAYDCFIAGQVAERQIERYGMPTNEAQAKWHREWATHFEQWLRDQGDPDATIGTEWPE